MRTKKEKNREREKFMHHVLIAKCLKIARMYETTWRYSRYAKSALNYFTAIPSSPSIPRKFWNLSILHNFLDLTVISILSIDRFGNFKKRKLFQRL